MKYTRDIITERYSSGEHLKYIFFWGHHPSPDGSITQTCLSQWFDCRFTADGVEYRTAEQYMMAQKALLFGDREIYNQIMKAGNPGEYKSLGRKIRGFDESEWESRRTDIVTAGNIAKFSQNPELRKYLLTTVNRVLVEASPYDRIWGIGLPKDAPDIENPYKWKGSNLLGFCLMEARDVLMEESK